MFAKTTSTLGLCLALACISIQAAPLSFESKTVKAKACFLDKNKKRKCNEKIVTYPITGDKYLDEIDIKNHWFEGQLPTEASIKAELQKIPHILENIKEYVVPDDTCTQHLEEDSIKLEGFTPNYAFFSRYKEAGCTSKDSSTYIIIRQRNQSDWEPFILVDMITPEQEETKIFTALPPKLIHIQKEAFIKQALQIKDLEVKEDDLRQHLEHKFYGTQDFLPAKDSMVFVFDTGYANNPFDRVIKVAIPLSDLQGIFKPEFLREIEQYTPRPEKP